MSVLSSPLALRAWMGAPGRMRSADCWGRRDTLLLASVLLLGAGLRAWDMGATLATSDQAALAWLVRYNYGFRWFFAHDYGPVLVIAQKAWATMLGWLGLPIEESAARGPVALCAGLQLLAAFALLRRVGCSRAGSGLGMLACAITPALVTDAHYAWGYMTLWVLAGTVALWATLAFLQERRPGFLLVAGVALVLHCLSNCFSFALPVSLLVAWGGPLRRADGRGRLRRAWCLGFLLPCLVAVAVIAGSWWWTGGGALGRLLAKQRGGSAGFMPGQLLQLPAMWGLQFGYAFGIPAALGLIYGTVVPRWRPLAAWCWASLLPLACFVAWDHVGYPNAYFMETAFSGALLGAAVLHAGWSRLGGRPRARLAFGCAAGLCLLHLGTGAVDACFNDARLFRWTGIRTGWGSIQPERGIKAAGWYVRTQVPADAVVLALHTKDGLEEPVAEYYLGRAVLAGYDLRPDMLEPVVRAMAGEVDVILCDAAWTPPADAVAGFSVVATFRAGGQPVRLVYARERLGLPATEEEVSGPNARYGRECRTFRVPSGLPAPPGYAAASRHYRRVVEQLRDGLSR